MTENAQQPSEPSEIDETQEFYNQVVKAKYLEAADHALVFEFGPGQTAHVERDEFGESLPFASGESVDLLVEQPVGDYWSASVRKAEKLEIWDWILGLLKSGEVVDGHILAENKGGLSVDIGVRAFLPMSQVDLHRVNDSSPYVGRQERFQVIKFDKKRGNIVVSRRNVLEQERKEQRKNIADELAAGQELEGVVRNITNYGAFVDVGGIDGLLHLSNMSWGRLDHPSELVRPGDKINVVVLEFDPKKKRLSLGRKQLLGDPWAEVEANFQEGAVVEGKVVSLADFGAFVEVAPGLEGLVHVTELAWTGRINHPKDVLNMGQNVRVQVVSIDTESRRMGLSIKRLEDNPWDKLVEALPVDSKLTGAIRNITDFGLFVEVAPNIEGLVHVSDISWTEKVDNPSDLYKVGDEVEVVVLDVDVEGERIGLGIKQLQDDPWKRAAELAKPGAKIDVTITRVTEFGAFAQLVEGVEGLIHISELAAERVEKVTDVVRPGQTVNALVLTFDRSNQRISLSLKRDELGEDESEAREYTEETGATATLGDILRDKLGLQSSEDIEAEAAGEEAEAEAAGEEKPPSEEPEPS